MNEMEEMMATAERVLSSWQPTKILFGEGSLQQVDRVIKKYENRMLLIIGKGSVKKNKVLDSTLESLGKNSLSYQVVEGVEPNPSLETVYRIVYRLLAGDFNCLLAVGGGSVIDAAKA